MSSDKSSETNSPIVEDSRTASASNDTDEQRNATSMPVDAQTASDGETTRPQTGGAPRMITPPVHNAPPQRQTLSFGQFVRARFRGILTGETPLWLIIALLLGAFLNLVTFAFLISPVNRANLQNPPIEEMKEMGMSATDIADRLTYSEQITPALLNTGAVITLISVCALVFTLIWRRRLGMYIYIVTTGVLLVATLLNGMFTPALLLVPTAVVITAAVNREFLQ